MLLGAAITLNELAALLVACHAPKKPAPGEEGAAALTRQGLMFFRKISQEAKKQLHATAEEDSNSVLENLVQLFDEEDDAFDELQEAVINDHVMA